jgi:hypothetical protein
MDRTFESMLVWFRSNLSASGEKPELTNLQNFSILPDNVTVVPAAERHEINVELAGYTLGQLRELMAESSASYTQDLHGAGTQNETATKTMARVNQASALIGAMLSLCYLYQKYQYIEIARRFCIKSSGDRDIESFQKAVLQAGVPKEALDSERWEIEPERAVGNGMKAVEIAQADRLMSVYPLLDPEAQRQALHIYVEANTDNPELAMRLVPPTKPEGNEATRSAHHDFATLMLAVPVEVRRDIALAEYIETLIRDLGQVVGRVEQAGGVPQPDNLAGAMTVAGHLEKQIQILAQRPSEKQRVAQYSALLAKIENLLRAQAQRLAEQQQQQNGGMDPKVSAEIQAQMMLAQSKAQVTEAQGQQKIDLRNRAFVADQQRKQAKLSGDLIGKARSHAQELRQSGQKHVQDLVQSAEGAKVGVAAKDLETQAKILRDQREADAAPVE